MQLLVREMSSDITPQQQEEEEGCTELQAGSGPKWPYVPFMVIAWPDVGGHSPMHRYMISVHI